MTQLVWHASQEEIPPADLVQLAVLAERGGFDGVHSSGHLAPWFPDGEPINGLPPEATQDLEPPEEVARAVADIDPAKLLDSIIASADPARHGSSFTRWESTRRSSSTSTRARCCRDCGDSERCPGLASS